MIERDHSFAAHDYNLVEMSEQTFKYFCCFVFYKNFKF